MQALFVNNRLQSIFAGIFKRLEKNEHEQR